MLKPHRRPLSLLPLTLALLAVAALIVCGHPPSFTPTVLADHSPGHSGEKGGGNKDKDDDGGGGGKEYLLTDLGVAAFPEEIGEPNDFGEAYIAGATGLGRDSGEPRVATVWLVDQTGTVLASSTIPPFDDTDETEAWGLNDAGYVVGFATQFDFSHTSFAFVETPDGTLTRLHDADAWSHSWAIDINNNGEIVGAARVTNHEEVGVIWEIDAGGTLLNVTTLSTFRPWAINDSGVMIGDLLVDGLPDNSQFAVAYFDDQGDLVVVPLEPLQSVDLSVEARAINESADVVGFANSSAGEVDATAWWSPDWGIEELDDLGGDHSSARGINDSLQIVGTDSTVAGYGKVLAFIWENGVSRDLNKLFESADGGKWSLERADDISNAGQIVGDGVKGSGKNEEPHGYLLTP